MTTTDQQTNGDRWRHAIWALAVLTVILLSSPALFAQYFGRNKVQFDKFDFRILATEHFDIYYYPSETTAAEQVGRMAERWHRDLSVRLQHTLSGRQPLVIYASHPEFEQTNVVEGLIDEGTGGVTEGARRRVVLPLAASLRETDHVLGHELVHAFQYDMLGRNIQNLPLWVVEGMAEYYSIGRRDAQTAMWLRDAARENRLPTIGDLDDPRYFPYRFGHAFWAYVAGRFGESTVTRILHTFGTRETFVPPAQAIQAVTQLKPDELSNAWHASIREAYGITPREKGVEEPVPAGQRALRATRDGRLDIGPSISPNGQRIAFLSERSRISIDLFVADVTGENVRQLTKSAVDPHFESLQFLASAGAWAPDNRRLAVATVRQGRGQVAIFDTTNGRLLQEIALPQPGEVFNPTWAPDGRQVAFSAQVGGHTDIFITDVTSGSVRRVTNDAFADLQPTWSADGRQLAFVTDRFSSNLDRLEFGAYEIGAIEVSNGRIQPLVTDLRGDATNPTWGAGDTLFFISTANGRPDVYQVSSRNTTPQAVVTAPTGIAGITPLSAALSVSRETNTLAFSVFKDNGYEIRFASATGSGESVARADYAVLPPGTSTSTSAAAEMPAQRVTEAPRSNAFTTQPYKASLSLIDVGQSVGVGGATGGYGTYVSGGISMLFSDVLGNHIVPLSFGVNGGVKDLAAQAGYINRAQRWNWGVFGEHVPLLSGTIQPGFESINGERFYVETTRLFRETSSQIGALAAYPFSRSLRVEFSGSARRIGFNEEVERAIYDPISGQLLDRTITDDTSAPSLRLLDTSAAIVRDTTAFGAVSPILGQRARLQITPTWGDLRMFETSADFRQYVVPVRPLTFAIRAMHLGRYGSDSEDGRLFPLFIGYSTLVRGYDPNDFGSEDCTPTESDSCPELNRLVGSRIAVVNAELRIPIGGLITGNYDYGPIPAELFGFFDAGIAWTKDAGAFPRDGQPWSRSIGFGARVNLFGFAIGEFNLARPLDRSVRRWDFVFNLRPGF